MEEENRKNVMRIKNKKKKKKKIKIQPGTIYRFNNNEILILTSESDESFRGMPVHKLDENTPVSTFKLDEIKRYINFNNVITVYMKDFTGYVFNKKKHLKISTARLNFLVSMCILDDYEYIIDESNPTNNYETLINKLKFSSWTKTKFNYNFKNSKSKNIINQSQIYWCDLGFNVGSELNKLRPCIIWKYISNRNNVTVIPLTTKKYNDKYYFHYDINVGEKSTARIENLINISTLRVVEPYYYKNKPVKITLKDKENIIEIIKKYYTFN